MRKLLGTLLVAFLLPSLAGAVPLPITGRVLHPPKEVRIELRPWAVGYEEALRRLKDEAVPPIASVRPQADGSFALRAPESGFYSVVVRAEGHLAMERFVRFLVEATEIPPVELPRTSPLEVRAVGPDGKPLAGVVIQALPQSEKGDWRAAERRAVTDAEGKAVFPRAEGEALTLTITTPGLYGTASTAPTGASQTVRFPVPRSRTVELRRPGGKPAAGALVRLARRGWPFGLTGPDGRIALPVPQEGEIGLFAEDAKGQRIEIVMTVEAGEGTDVPVVTLRPPTMVTGRTLDAASREPVSGALVWTGGTAWTRAGADGSFELRAPSGDHGRVEASASGRLHHVRGWQRNENVPATLLLESAATLSGQVVDEAGKPVAGARVTTLPNPADQLSAVMEERESQSGPDGRFVLPKVPAGRLHLVEAVLEGFAPARQLADSTAPVRLTLRRGMVAVGRVVSEEGLPVAGAQVRLTPDGAGQVPTRPKPFLATSDADGRFRLHGLSAGPFTLGAERSGFASVLVRDVLIPEQEQQVDLGEVRLQPGAAIEGIVTDPRGRPVERAWVMLIPFNRDGFMAAGAGFYGRPPMHTDSDGRFRIADLPLGLRFNLRVQHQELLPEEVTGVEAPTPRPLRIRLSLPRSLAGRVIDPQGEPIANASVSQLETASAPDGSNVMRSLGEKARTDEEGRFVLSRVKPGSIQLHVSAFGYRGRDTQGIRIPEEGEAAPVEITLEPGTSLQGRVLDSRDLPVPHASVHARGSGREGQAFFKGSASTDEEGRYELVDLEPGPYEIEAFVFEQGRSARAAVEIQPGRNQLDLRLPGGVEVAGRVVDSQGAPVPAASLSLVPIQRDGSAMGMGARGLSSADGSFVLADVPDGEYRLTASRQGFAASVLPEVRVAGAPVSGLELRLAPGAVIRGRILGLAPEELRKAMIAAFSEQVGSNLRGSVAADGSYRVPDVAPGDWHVIAQIPPESSIEGRVQVAEGEQEVVLDLELPTGFILSGRVLSDGGPLPDARVIVAQDGQRPYLGVTGHDGTFRIERVPAGSYKLLVMLSPEAVSLSRTIEVTGDQEVTLEIGQR